MIENINNDINLDVAVIYASNKIDRNDQETNYEENKENEEYILIKDPIRRIADMNY